MSRCPAIWCGSATSSTMPARPAQIAIYRAPDLGTTGTLPVDRVLTALRAHQVIGVDTRNLTRNFDHAAGPHARGQGDRARDRPRAGAQERPRRCRQPQPDLRPRRPGRCRLDASNTGALQAISARFDSRNNRFDVTFEIANEAARPPTKLRFTGTAVETVEAAVLARGVERNEVIKSSDVVIERRPKAEVGNDVATRDRAVGMQARRQLRAGQALKTADLAKPDLVQKDQAVAADLPGGRTSSHHSRQGAGGRHRRRRRQRASTCSPSAP